MPGCGLSLDDDANGVPDECEGLSLIFEPAQRLGPNVNTTLRERGPELSADGLVIVFNSASGGGQTDIVMATRSALDSPFGAPTSIPNLDTVASEAQACLSSDMLDIYFGYCCPSQWEIYVASRGSTGESFGAPVNVGGAINNSGRNMSPHITSDGLKLYYVSEQTPGNYGTTRVMSSTRATIGAPWQPGVLESGPINDTLVPKASVAPNDLVLFFCTERAGTLGVLDNWMATRETTADPWSTPLNLGPAINTAAPEEYPFYSRADHAVYFSSLRPGSQDYDLYVSRITNDCNQNFIADDCDLDCGPLGGICDVPGCGLSDDCQPDGVPDECDIADGTSDDCNVNDVPDECDLASGSSSDDNSNGIPDECMREEGIPAVSTWGLLGMMLLLFVAGTVLISKRARLAAA